MDKATRKLENPADIVFLNGAVYTVDPGQPWAESLAVTAGIISYVGDNQGGGQMVGPATRVVNLAGRMMLPGFIDSHAHVSTTVSLIAAVQFAGLTSIEAYLDAALSFAAANSGAEAIYGGGWKNELFSPLGPGKELLDGVIADKPVSLSSSDCHALWVNSVALVTAGITADTPDPPGGVIERDPETGEPSGTLRETAMDLVSNALPPYTLDQLKEGIRDYSVRVAAEGICTVHDPMLILPEDPSPMLGTGVYGENIKAFCEMAADGELNIRVRGSLLADPSRAMDQLPQMVSVRDTKSSDNFAANSIKIFVDGVVDGHTAYLLEPYRDKPDTKGEPIWNPEDLNEFCRKADREGFQVHMHAIGDAATRMSLNALESARKTNGPRDSRHAITHLQLVADEDIKRFADLDVIGMPQPIWHHKGENYTDIVLPYLGKKRADRQFPMKRFMDAGVCLAGASDFPVDVPSPPLTGIMIGTTRHEPGKPDEILWPEERVTLAQLIESYTIKGAYANRVEDVTGSLVEGKSADIVVLERNLFDIPPTEIADVKVILTFLEGNEVYGSGEL
jgi:predicted amidohydrolase YtcJ